MFIYKISNASASQVYIGSTTETLRRRMTRHRSKAKVFGSRKLYAAMSQSDDWRIELVMDLGTVTKAELLNAELRFITAYNSIEQGLNTRLPIRKIKN